LRRSSSASPPGKAQKPRQAEARASLWCRPGGRRAVQGRRRLRCARASGLFQVVDKGIVQRLRGRPDPDILGCAGHQHPPRVHQRDPVAAHDLGHAMGGQEDRDVLLPRQVHKRLPEHIARHRINTRARLVEDQNLGPVDQRDRQRQAHRQAVEHRIQIEPPRKFGNARADARLVPGARPFATQHLQPSLLQFPCARDQRKQARFAYPVGIDKPGDAPCLEIDAHCVKRGDAAVSERQALCTDNRGGRRHSRTRPSAAEGQGASGSRRTQATPFLA